MINKLKGYYNRVGISAVNFNCKHNKECRSTCLSKSKFATAREPYIGKFYGKKGLPKLLFLSLDPGDSDGKGNRKKEKKSRTIKGMREGNLRLSLKQMPKQNHWYKTHQFAWLILDEFQKLSKRKIDFGKTNNRLYFESDFELHKIMPYFAHTNSAKCCVNNVNKKQANRKLFDNCRAYLPEELRIFDPHILVTQGQLAQKVVEETIKVRVFSLLKERNLSMAKRPDFRVIEVNPKRPVVWIHHYHPSNYGAFNRMVYPNYRNYAKAAVRFVADKYPELLHSR